MAIRSEEPLFIKESAAALADVAGWGQFWVKNDTPNTPYFTDDAGTDIELATLTGVLQDLAALTAVSGADQLIVSTGAGTYAHEAASTLPATIGGVIQDLDALGAPSADGEFIVATGAGAFAYESGATARSSLGLGTADSPRFTKVGINSGGTPNSYLGIGDTGSTGSLIYMKASTTGFVGQEGITLEPTFNSDATLYGIGIKIGTSTEAASFTIPDLYNIRIGDVSKGAGSTITRQYGLYVANQTQGATNYSVWLGSGLYHFDALTASRAVFTDGSKNLVSNEITGTEKVVMSNGAVLTGLLTTIASASGGAGFRLPHGAAPSSPVDGDIWTTTAGIFVRINGSTVGPLA